MALLSVFVGASYFLVQAGQMFRWPAWVLNLSLFRLYGAPLSQGVWWPGLWALLAVDVLSLVAAAIALARRDLGR